MAKTIKVSDGTFAELDRLRNTDKGKVSFDNVIEWLLRSARTDVETRRPR